MNTEYSFSPKYDKFLFGAAYYAEYMPYDRIDTDFTHELALYDIWKDYYILTSQRKRGNETTIKLTAAGANMIDATERGLRYEEWKVEWQKQLEESNARRQREHEEATRKEEKRKDLLEKYEDLILDLKELNESDISRTTDEKINGEDTLDLLRYRKLREADGTLKEKVIFTEDVEMQRLDEEENECRTRIEDLEKRAERLYKDEYSSSFAFYELVYLPLKAVMNVQKMWIYTGLNHAYARMGSTVANTLAGRIDDCIKEDRKLVEGLHRIHGEKWYAMGLSEHIGFKYWCEEQCQYPIVHTFECANKPRLIVSIPSTGEYTEGGFWTGRELTLPDALDPSSDGGYIELSTASSGRVSYVIESDDGFIKIEDHKRSVKCGKSRKVFISVDRSAIGGDDKNPSGTVRVTSENNTIVIRVPVGIKRLPDKTEKNTYTGVFFDDGSGYISIVAVNWSKKTDSKSGSFETVEGLAREGSSIKAYPQNVIFTQADSPKVTYSFMIARAGRYDISLYTSPANPPYPDNTLLFSYSVNSLDTITDDMIPEGYSVAAGNTAWSEGVLDNIRIKTITVQLSEGINELTIGALYPGFVLEKIVITREGETLPYSYLGPPESFHS